MGILARRFVTELATALERECVDYSFRIGQDDPKYEHLYQCSAGTPYGDRTSANALMDRVKRQLKSATPRMANRGLEITENHSGDILRWTIGPARYFMPNQGPTEPVGQAYVVQMRVLGNGDPFSGVEWTIPTIGAVSFAVPETRALDTFASRTSGLRGVPMVLTPGLRDSWALPMLTGLIYRFDVSQSTAIQREVLRLGGELVRPDAGADELHPWYGFLPWERYTVSLTRRPLVNEDKTTAPIEILFPHPDKKDYTIGGLIMMSPNKSELYLMVMDKVLDAQALSSAPPIEVSGLTAHEYQTLFPRQTMNGTNGLSKRAAEGKAEWPVGLAVASLAAIGLVGLGVVAGVAGAVMQKRKGGKRRK